MNKRQARCRTKIMKPNSDHKNWALMTGFPFENDVEAILQNLVVPELKFTLGRNREFDAVNEENEAVIRSIDFEFSFRKPSKNIPLRDWNRSVDESIEFNILIDAKFSSDEKYLFLPTLSDKHLKWPYLVPCVEGDDHFDRKVRFFRKDLADFAALEGIPISSNGRKVKEIGKERDSVTSAVLQVVQGLSYVLEVRARALGETSKQDYSYTRSAHYFLPIVVTNSPLYLLKKGVGVELVENAKSEDVFFESFDLIGLEIPKAPNLIKAWEKAKQALVSSGRKSLVWEDSGVENLQIVFCTTKGLKKILNQLIVRFQAIRDIP